MLTFVDPGVREEGPVGPPVVDGDLDGLEGQLQPQLQHQGTRPGTCSCNGV